MHKCTNCGAEFEGNFCPECGESVSKTKVCPACGAECASGAKFCSICGYSFAKGESAKQPAKAVAAKAKISPKTEAAFKRAHNIFEVLPAWMLFIFSVLAFIFMALPAVATPSIDIMGQTIPSENLGSLYAAYGGMVEDVPIKGCAAAALLFAVFSALLTCVLIAFNKVKQLKSSAVTLMGIYRVRIKKIAEILCTPVYLTFIIISSCAMGVISATDGGAGLITAGTGVILLLVFSCLAFALAVACAAADRFIVLKNFPQLEKIPERKPREFHGSAPKEVAKPQKPVKPQKSEIPLWQEKQLKRYAILKRMSYIGALPTILSGVYIIIFGSFGLLPIEIIIVIIFFAAIILAILFLKPKILNIKLKKALIIMCLLVQCFIMFLFIYQAYFIIFSIITDKFYSYYDYDFFILNRIVTFISLVLGLFEIILCIATLVNGKKVKNLLYTDKKQGTLTDYGKDFVQRQNAYTAAIKQHNEEYNADMSKFNTYMSELEEYDLEREMCAAGYDYGDSTERKLFWVRTHKALTAVIAVLIAAAIVLAVVLPAALAPAAAAV